LHNWPRPGTPTPAATCITVFTTDMENMFYLLYPNSHQMQNVISPPLAHKNAGPSMQNPASPLPQQPAERDS